MKRRHSEIESQTVKTFRNASKLPVRGSNVIILEPSSKTDKLYEFELNSTQVVNFGLHTGFIVEGIFEKKPVGADAVWESCDEDDVTLVTVQANWFDHMVKEVDIFHVNAEISPHDAPLQADAFLNSYLLAHMHPTTKKFLCPEPCHPGNATSHTKTGWKMGEDSDWRTYGAHIFNSQPIKFRYIPLFKFPFYQKANFIMDNDSFEPLPIPAIGPLQIRFYLKDNINKVFKRAAANLAEYRFRLMSINLALEELRLNPTIEKTLMTSKKRIEFFGVTKLGMAHNIPAGVFTYTAKLNKIYLPQGLFIFCLPRGIIPGNYDYSTFADNVFLNHNIKSIGVYFGGKMFYSKSPTPHDLGSTTSNNKHFFDHMSNPPFGVKQDPDKLFYELIKDGGSSNESPFPHVYIDLTQGTPNTRLATENADANLIQGREMLDVAMQFKNPGATNGTYFVYYFYTDKNVDLDLNAKRFINIYNNTKLTV